ncbi:MAG: hypothetical protein MR598_08455 [Erysipelotrichaceae bacterium]|nr:hypothetical protein [Erysipelotrichaceae bacterium]
MTPRQELIKYLLDFGFLEEEVVSILNDKTIKQSKEETILAHAKDINDYLLREHCSKEEIIKEVTDFPKLYGHTQENIEQKNKDLLELGFSKQNIQLIRKRFSRIYSYSKENIKNTIESIQKMGFTKKQVMKMVILYPSLIGYKITTLQQKKQDLIDFGYEEKDAVKILKTVPIVFQNAKETMAIA